MSTFLNTFRPLQEQVKQTELAYDIATQDLINYNGSSFEDCEALTAIAINTYHAWKASLEAFDKAYYALPKN